MLLIKIDPLWVYQGVWRQVGTHVSDSDLWGCPRARVMIVFVFYVDPHFPYIGYFGVYDAYEGI